MLEVFVEWFPGELCQMLFVMRVCDGLDSYWDNVKGNLRILKWSESLQNGLGSEGMMRVLPSDIEIIRCGKLCRMREASG